VFVRPHALELARHPNGSNTIRAITKHVHAAGPTVKVEAVTEWNAPIQVEITQEHFRTLALQKGDEIFVTPRHVAVFPSD
jgi:sulfate transport system ATP-binding protein